MIIRWSVVCVLLCAGAFSGIACRRASAPVATSLLKPDEFKAQQAYDEVAAFVALGPRSSGGAGAAQAASYLAARLEHIGVQPLVDEFQDNTPAGPVVFRNVLAAFQGARPDTIILISHYDTKTGISDGFVGANDSGSSTGVLLELARILQSHQALPCDILLAFLDGEECRTAYGPRDGLHGSRRLAQTLVRNGRAANVRAVILLDMIGDRNLHVAIPRNSTPALVSRVFTAAHEDGVRGFFSLGDSGVLDDHVPFLQAGIPAVDLIDFDYGSAPGRNDYWHTAQDTLDKLSARSLEITGRVVIRVLDGLIGTPSLAPSSPRPDRARP